MDLDRLNKRAKNLKKFLPEFVAVHGATPALSACQELAARLEGIPSYHAAQQRASSGPAPANKLSSALGALECWIWEDIKGWRKPRAWQEPGSAVLSLSRRDSDMAEIEGMLDDHLEKSLPGPVSYLKEMSPKALQKLVKLSEKAREMEPGFLYATALQVGALTELNRAEEAAWLGAAQVALVDFQVLPPGFAGEISYLEASNRGYHRLNHHLVLALQACGRNEEAAAVAHKMVRFWRRDNLGFRLLVP